MPPMSPDVRLMPAITRSTFAAEGPLRQLRWGRLRRWLAARRDATASRARRVVLLIVLLSVVNAFDLAFTLLASSSAHFVELNPIAAGLVHTTAGLVAFKILTVLLAFCILFHFRRRALTELACWALCGVYAALAGRWWLYYFIYQD